ncbi:MAG: flotillin-like protein FloA [Planctomycetes bacterium]|nr:flotillin-like protein FloA [Planctomycetota bacterium]
MAVLAASSALLVVVAALVVALLVALIVFWRFVGLWLQAKFSGVPISIVELIAMKMRKVDATALVSALIVARQAGVPIQRRDLEAHLLAGGHVLRVVGALVAANRADIPLTFKDAAAIDLAGRDVLEAVRVSVHPKVIDCPEGSNQTGAMLTAIALNGVEILVRARVTVRSNLKTLVGGATEETVIARVGQGIVSAVGSMKNHQDVLANPEVISKKVQEIGVDAGTAYQVLSIDIVDLDVGQNIGAHLDAERAVAAQDVAQARAEERRAAAVAHERENIALVREKEAEFVLAHTEIPNAVAQALREGTMSVAGYLRWQNVQADTRMRARISGRPVRTIGANTGLSEAAV